MAKGIGRVFIVTDVSAPGLGAFGLLNDLSSDTDTSDSDWEDGKTISVRSAGTISIGAPKKRRRSGKASKLQAQKEERKHKKQKSIPDPRKAGVTDKKLKSSKKARSHSKLPEPHIEALASVYHNLPSSGPIVCASLAAESWSNIPSELLVKIASELTTCYQHGCAYVGRCAQVCRHWRDVLNQSIVWKEIDLQYLAHRIGANADSTLITLMNRGLLTETRVLNLTGWKRVTDKSLSLLPDHCFKLEDLLLSGCQLEGNAFSKISSKSLLPVSEMCPLRRLDLSSTNVPKVNSVITTLLLNCGSTLVSLRLANIKAIGSSLLTAIITHCSQLEVLDLSATSVRVVRIELFQNACPKMRELFLSDIPFQPSLCKDSDKSCGFPNLRVFSIGQSFSGNMVAEDSLRRFLFASEKLNTLDVRGCRELTERCPSCIPSFHVRKLFLSKSRISSVFLRSACQKWPSLTYVDMSYADVIEANFNILMKILAAGCQHLTHVNLAGTALTDCGVSALLQGCPDIIEVDLTSCKGVSRGIKRLHSGKEAIDNIRKIVQHRP